MDALLKVAKCLYEVSRGRVGDVTSHVKWNEVQALRASVLRLERGDASGWHAFLNRVHDNPETAYAFRRVAFDLGWAELGPIEGRPSLGRLVLRLPESEFPGLATSDLEQLRHSLDFHEPKQADATAQTCVPGTVMYLEEKPGLTGPARIGRVHFSASRKTIRYKGRELRSLKGAGFKANFVDVDSGLEYWVSNCRTDGNDTLYPGIVEIDEDAREEYWTVIRKCPERLHLTRVRSQGKCS